VERTLLVKLRYNEPAVPARVADLGAGRALVEPLEPQPGIAPGQACVVYEGSRLVGGGWIEHAPPVWQAEAARLSA
jgi:tRNA-specific 2-thiouridylase